MWYKFSERLPKVGECVVVYTLVVNIVRVYRYDRKVDLNILKDIESYDEKYFTDDDATDYDNFNDIANSLWMSMTELSNIDCNEGQPSPRR